MAYTLQDDDDDDLQMTCVCSQRPLVAFNEWHQTPKQMMKPIVGGPAESSVLKVHL